MLKDELIKKLQEIVKELTEEDIQIEISRSNDSNHGDYSSNVAFLLSKIKKENPGVIASRIIELLVKKYPEVFSIIDQKPNAVLLSYINGFINFNLPQEYLIKKVLLLAQGEFGLGKLLEGKKISLEFTDPNPFKEFHIGHLYTNTVGESLGRIFEANGATVWRADYFGDVGMHVAKALYGLQQKFAEDSLSMEDLGQKSLKERIEYFGQAYAKGSSLFDGEEHAEKIKKLNKIIFIAAQKMWQKEKGLEPQIDYVKDAQLDEKELEEVYNMYTIGRAWSLEYFESMYKRLGMAFVGYYPESIAGERGYKLVKEHIEDGVFEASQGAIIFPGKKYGLHDRVFINSLGLPTYEAKELGLAPWKYEDFQYDQSIILTGNEILEYFKVLIKAMTMINEDLGKKTMHIGHGMVRLPQGKMSSRTGNVLTGEWLIDEAEKKAQELSKHSLVIEETEGVTESYKQGESARHQAMKPSQLMNSTEQVALGAIKYAFLKASIGKDVEFDLDTSLSLSGNSGPYLQYTHVRTIALLQKAGDNNGFWTIQNDSYKANTEELSVLRQLEKSTEIVEQAALTYSPNLVANYLFELAQIFNNFYQKHRIADASSEEEKQFRLALTQAVGNVLKKGLNLLGIEAPRKM